MTEEGYDIEQEAGVSNDDSSCDPADEVRAATAALHASSAQSAQDREDMLRYQALDFSLRSRSAFGPAGDVVADAATFLAFLKGGE